MNHKSTFDQINAEIRAAEEYLATIKQAVAYLEEAGVYPAIPWEHWKDERYPYLKFQDTRLVDGLDLDKKHRLYIGSKADNIAEARRLVRNTEHHQRLWNAARQLTLWLDQVYRAIADLSRRAQAWPQLDANLWDQPQLEEIIDA